MKSGIYSIINTINHKIYVGSAIDLMRRKAEHFHKLRHNIHANKYLQNAWNKYGENGFEFNIIEFVIDKLFLPRKEQFWIDFYKSADRKFGYNLRLFAKSNVGLKWSDKTKNLMSIARKGLLVKEKNGQFGKYGIISLDGIVYSLCKYGHIKTPDNMANHMSCKTCKNQQRKQRYLKFKR